MTALRGIKGVGFRLVLYKGRDDEQRRDSTWQLDFSKAHPDMLTVYVNILSKELDLSLLQHESRSTFTSGRQCVALGGLSMCW